MNFYKKYSEYTFLNLFVNLSFKLFNIFINNYIGKKDKNDAFYNSLYK
jgi:hypothetical protein